MKIGAVIKYKNWKIYRLQKFVYVASLFNIKDIDKTKLLLYPTQFNIGFSSIRQCKNYINEIKDLFRNVKFVERIGNI